MTLSTGPWWWAPVFALGWMTTVPAHSFSAPARACVIAAARFMPGVCAVLTSSSFACTTRTPSNFQFDPDVAIVSPGRLHYAFGGGTIAYAPSAHFPRRALHPWRFARPDAGAAASAGQL